MNSSTRHRAVTLSHRLRIARRPAHGERTLRPREGRFHGPVKPNAASSNSPTAAPPSSTKWAISPSNFRSNSCACCRNANSGLVGSLQRVQVDIRIIAATHRDLPAKSLRGRFREDLFHRLNVVRLTLPPLRERREDIPLLVEHFLPSAGHYTLDSEATDAIMAYDWPGNIRELKNCVDRMVAFNSGPVLHFADLPTGVANHGQRERAMAAGAAAGALDTRRIPVRPARDLIVYRAGRRSLTGSGSAVRSSKPSPTPTAIAPQPRTVRHRPHHALPQTERIRSRPSAGEQAVGLRLDPNVMYPQNFENRARRHLQPRAIPLWRRRLLARTA